MADVSYPNITPIAKCCYHDNHKSKHWPRIGWMTWHSQRLQLEPTPSPWTLIYTFLLFKPYHQTFSNAILILNIANIPTKSNTAHFLRKMKIFSNKLQMNRNLLHFIILICHYLKSRQVRSTGKYKRARKRHCTGFHQITNVINWWTDY